VKAFVPCGITLKALANFSPGFALKPGIKRIPIPKDATLKGLRRRSHQPQTPSELRRLSCALLNPGFQSKPWPGICQRFSVIPQDNERCHFRRKLFYPTNDIRLIS
jgi:hypothetical protein